MFLGLSHVCCFWRAVALNELSLWGTLWCLENKIRTLESFRRAGDAPLDLTVYKRHFIDGQARDITLQLLQLRRLRSLEVNCLTEQFRDVVRPTLVGTAPILTRLDL
jgi:hypothetical protein